jgi:rhodanese-related sulfurtransferase
VRRQTSTLAILLEALLVVAAGVGFAFAANALSPRGLKLARNYFPGAAVPSTAPARTAARPPGAASSTNDNSAEALVTERLKAKRLQPLSRAETERLLHDPRYEQGIVVFVDARNEDEFAQGHIPGAWALDPFHPEKQLAAVLTPCQNASQVVVYCQGGDCEDAESAAIILRDAGVSNENLFIFAGGFTDWTEHRLPVETGPRNSGAAPVERK